MAEAYTEHDIEILVATMNRSSLDFLVPMFPPGQFEDTRILVINQTAEDKILTSGFKNVRVINALEEGLSKSRNLALKNALGKICIITDDDVVFTPGFKTTVCTAFNENPDAAMIAFRAKNGHGALYRKYKNRRITNTTTIDRLLILSIEMVVNREFITQKDIRFDEQFGLGSAFMMGEEAIFVKALYDAGGKLVLEPQVIVSHASEDTHKRVTVVQKYYVQGAFFSRLFGAMWLMWVFSKIASELKNNKIRFAEITVAITAAFAGRKAFKEHEKNNA